MFTPEFWSRLDDVARVPIELAVVDNTTEPFGSIEIADSPGGLAGATQDRLNLSAMRSCVSTKAPLIYARRNHVISDDALSWVKAAVLQTFHECGVVLTEDAVRTPNTETLVIDISDDALWLIPPQPYLDVLAARAHDIRSGAPDVTIVKQRMMWQEFAGEVGEDTALWAALNAANAKPPFTISGDVETLASRRDENALALIRRAHAASVIRLDAASKFTGETPVKQGENDTYLRATLVWANRVSYDTKRHQRTRPLTFALEKTAQVTIRHLEQAPVTRTDSLALEAARTLFAKSLACVNLVAPVPA